MSKHYYHPHSTYEETEALLGGSRAYICSQNFLTIQGPLHDAWGVVDAQCLLTEWMNEWKEGQTWECLRVIFSVRKMSSYSSAIRTLLPTSQHLLRYETWYKRKRLWLKWNTGFPKATDISAIVRFKRADFRKQIWLYKWMFRHLSESKTSLAIVTAKTQTVLTSFKSD